MTAPQPVSLAELRKPCGPDERLTQEAIDILCDIAEAAQAMFETADRSGENADLWFEGDRMEATEQALKKVRP